MKNVLGKPPNGAGDERKCLNKSCQHKSSPSLPIISGWGDILQEQLLSSVWRLAGKSLELQPGFRKEKGFPSCIFSHRKYGENAHWEYIRSSYGIMSEVTSPNWLLLIKTNIKSSSPPHPPPLNPFYTNSDAPPSWFELLVNTTADSIPWRADGPTMLSKSTGIWTPLH